MPQLHQSLDLSPLGSDWDIAGRLSACLCLQGTAHDDLKDVSEKMIVAQTQSFRLLQRLQQADPAAAAEAEAAADAIAGGTGSEGDLIRCQLERIAELERECKRLKQVSR